MISKKQKISKLESKKTKTSLKAKLEPYAFLFPSLLIFGLFVYYPFFKTLYMSFGLTNARGEFQEFIGLQNYVEIFTSPDFINSLIVTMEFVIMTTIPSVVIGLALALLANNKIKGIGISKVMYAVPIAVSSASAAIIWRIIFHPSIGMLNNILKTNIGWLLDPKWALLSVAFVTIWMNAGVNFIFIFAGLKNVPQEILESSSIDGARYFTKLFKIIMPMISPTLFFMVFMDIMNAFQSFGQINILTNGGPGNSTNVLVFSIYREAFFNGRFDTASAQSIILFILMAVIAMFQFSYEKKGVHYS
ncbi:sugar ABC transporter permease [Clostridium algoriphilum]|uniref:carbohydrate ABC transporter permease n=1 Tax=Clostridium algoriphilum TaxID=198347 RepID=UPI001CF5F899|nr:sugar ABC transporter permease [Clostridium algoriphilum]